MLAIVIPYYKLTFFEITLQSLVNQTNKKFKVYIGDDASPENPAFLLNKYKSKIDFVYHRFNDNLGAYSLVKQWDRCIELIGEENWIMILGDDDVLGDNVVDSFYTNLYEVVSCSINVVRFSTIVEQDSLQLKAYKATHPKFEMISDFYYRKFKGYTRSSLSEYIFRKEAYLKNKFKEYPLGWHSDDRAWLDFSDKKPILSINEAEVLIRISDYSISGKNNNKAYKDNARLMFFSDLLTSSLDDFSNKTKLLLLIRYEEIITYQKKAAIKDWCFIISKYFKIGSFIEIVKVFRRMLINQFSK